MMIRAAESDIEESTVSAGREPSRFRSILVVGEVALVVVLLTGTGLLNKGWRDAARASPGFVPQNLLTLLPRQVL
jgi:hypothetical protein